VARKEKRMTTLVFGGAGFVGLNIAERLLAKGRDVTLFDRRPPPAPAAAHFATLPGRLRVVVGDVRAPGAITEAFAEAPRFVVYGAALTPGPAREAADPLAVVEVNLVGLVRALEAARAAGTRRVVNLSSAGAYGARAFGAAALDEETAPDPVSLYAVTKFASERVATRLAALWGTDFRSVRLSAVFGPWEHDSGVRDTLSPPYQVARMALAGVPIILPRPVTRDWVYAHDVSDAVIALLDAAAPLHPVYNVTPAAGWTLLDWARRFAALRPGLVVRLAEPGEAPNIDPHSAQDRALMTNRRLADDIGFVPRYGIEAAFADFAAWRERHPDAWVGG
jgi:UDP-glucose 4-epimerase